MSDRELGHWERMTGNYDRLITSEEVRGWSYIKIGKILKDFTVPNLGKQKKLYE